jgi:RNA polymerase sigma factor (sigma-70 family)
VTPRRAAPEADATRELYERYARQIYAYCFHQLGNREEAEDATQSTFLNAFRGLQRGVDPEFETAWLYKIAQNVCLTRQRSSSRRRRLETPGDLDAMQDYVPAHQVDSDELIHLPEALDAMPEQQRRALLLREWQGLSYKEIADELGLTQPAVETLLFRARRTLAASLTDEPVAKKSAAKKVQRGSDAGSVAAIAKTLILSGGAKVAATVATVAATSVVAATPTARHAVEDVVAPRHDIVPVHQPAVPVRHAAAAAVHEPSAVTSPVSSAPSAPAPVVHAPSRPVTHVRAHVTAPRHASAAEAVDVSEAKPVERPARANEARQPKETPAAHAPGQQKKLEVAPTAPAPVQEKHGNRKANGNGNGSARAHENARREPLGIPSPAPAEPVPATTDPSATTPAQPADGVPSDPPAADEHGNGNAYGHGK